MSKATKRKQQSLSVASRKVLREEEDNKKPTPGLSDFFRKKHENSPNLSFLPKDPAGARAYACSQLRAKGSPPAGYES